MVGRSVSTERSMSWTISPTVTWSWSSQSSRMRRRRPAAWERSGLRFLSAGPSALRLRGFFILMLLAAATTADRAPFARFHFCSAVVMLARGIEPRRGPACWTWQIDVVRATNTGVRPRDRPRAGRRCWRRVSVSDASSRHVLGWRGPTKTVLAISLSQCATVVGDEGRQ